MGFLIVVVSRQLKLVSFALSHLQSSTIYLYFVVETLNRP